MLSSKRIPAVEHLSLAHSLQNIWLKATALGLGMQLLSIMGQLGADKEFCDLLKIPPEELALGGCLLGFPDMNAVLSGGPSLKPITISMS